MTMHEPMQYRATSMWVVRKNDSQMITPATRPNHTPMPACIKRYPRVLSAMATTRWLYGYQLKQAVEEYLDYLSPHHP